MRTKRSKFQDSRCRSENFEYVEQSRQEAHETAPAGRVGVGGWKGETKLAEYGQGGDSDYSQYGQDLGHLLDFRFLALVHRIYSTGGNVCRFVLSILCTRGD